MSSQRNRIIAAVAVVALGVGAFLAYDTFLRGDDVDPLALPSASSAAVASSEPTETDAASPDPRATDPASPNAGSLGAAQDVAGVWTIVEDSQAGYRVTEQLADLPAETEAVGRTSDVSGSITLVASGDALELTDGSITVDTTTITSDEGMRDNRMRTQGLETDTFTNATFVITAPVDVPTPALDGAVVDLVLTGDLTLHGVTKAVEIPARAQIVDRRISVVGSLTFPLSDFDIVAPNVGGFIVSIADHGTLEFLVTLARA